MQHQQPERGHAQHRRHLCGRCDQQWLDQRSVVAGGQHAAAALNVALAANGGVAAGLEHLQRRRLLLCRQQVNDGERAGVNWGHGGGWNEYRQHLSGLGPDHLQQRQDHRPRRRLYPPGQLRQSGPAHRHHDLLPVWRHRLHRPGFHGGGTWVTLGTVSGNNLVKRTVNFTAVHHDRIRINVTAALASYARITEIEAWGTSAGPPPQSNVALATNGGVASASSTYSAADYSFAASSVNDGERAGLNWGHGGGWNDNTANSYPDWVQIIFNGAKTIDHVVVYTLQDNYANPVEPTDTLTFTQYGVTGFTVQGWTGGGTWTTLGTVSGNNLVKRTVNFNAYTTARIRINVTGALASYSRITEIEAWGN